MLFVMKLSKLCNLRCNYCYEYAELADRTRMPLEGLSFFLQSVGDYYMRHGLRETVDFVLHGGEPLLLPEQYLRELARLQAEHLASRNVPFRNLLQTNLTRVSDSMLGTLADLNIHLGISLDVFGGERVGLTGSDSQERVLDNLQKLFDADMITRLGVGGISVLHAGNVDRAVNVFHFYHELGLSYRILPIFSLTDPPARMRHLMLTTEQVLSALQDVARTQFRAGLRIAVFPLWNYLHAAVHYLTGIPASIYNPEMMEWAFIVNTNGDVYNHAEAYTPVGHMGNIFHDTLEQVFESGGRRQTLMLRAERARLCDQCRYGHSCSRIPIVEALPSERHYDSLGNLYCAIAQPMIEFMVDEIRRDSSVMGMVEHAALMNQPPSM